LGKRRKYLNTWTDVAGAHEQEFMNFHPEDYDAGAS